VLWVAKVQALTLKELFRWSRVAFGSRRPNCNSRDMNPNRIDNKIGNLGLQNRVNSKQ